MAPKRQNPKPTDWFEFITNNAPKMAIPFGPRFQAYIPTCTGRPENPNNEDPETQKWLGTKTWPINEETLQTHDPTIGNGRPNSCQCLDPKDCVKLHKTENRNRLKLELGDLFFEWKFDEMGEEVSEKWKSNEEKLFKTLVIANPVSKGRSFIKPALEKIPFKNRTSLVSYYFNVYLPREISQHASVHYVVDTDDEMGPIQRSKKRDRAGGAKRSYLSEH